MRFIAGSLVVLSGSILWGAAVLATSWAYQTGGNRGAADMATFGGVTVIAIGCLILLFAHFNRLDRPK